MYRNPEAGTLFLLATPIGNLADITLRGLEVLKKVGVVCCEDTRTSGVLFAAHGIRVPRLVSYHEHNEEQRVPQVLELLKSGQDVVLVSDAGTPNISDPGFRLVSAAIKAGYCVSPLPGPCALAAAVSASGLPTDRFLYLGFPPHKKSKVAAFLEEALFPGRTSVFYLPMRKVPSFLQQIVDLDGSTSVVIARELTKLHEEFIRGTAAELLARMDSITQKGECTFLCYREKQKD